MPPSNLGTEAGRKQFVDDDWDHLACHAYQGYTKAKKGAVVIKVGRDYQGKYERYAPVADHADHVAVHQSVREQIGAYDPESQIVPVFTCDGEVLTPVFTANPPGDKTPRNIFDENYGDCGWLELADLVKTAEA